MAEEKKKKSHAGLIIFIVILIIIGLPIGLAYGFFYDGSHHEKSTYEKEISAVVEDSLFDSFKETSAKKKLHFAITQQDLNAVFAKLYNDMPQDAKNYVDGLFVDIKDNHYDFTLEAHVPLFASKAIISTTLSDEVNATSPLDGRFVFRIDDVKVGRLGGALGIAKNFAAKDIINLGKNLQNLFEKNGIHITVDLEKEELVYTKRALLQDAGAFMGNNDYLNTFLSTFFEKQLITLDTQSGPSLAFDTNLEPLHTNASHVVEEDGLSLPLRTYSEALLTLTQSNGIDNLDQLAKIFQYLIRGYDGVPASVRSAVSAIDFSSIGIADYTQYKGEDLEEDKVDLAQSMKEQALANLPTFATEHLVGSITEEDLNSMLHASSIIGSGTILAKKVIPVVLGWFHKGTIKEVAYLTFSDVTAQITQDHIHLTIGMSLNGYQVRFVVVTKLNSTPEDLNQYKIRLDIENMYFGNLEASAALQKTLKEYLGDALGNAGVVAYQNGSIVFDFSSSIDALTDTAIKLVGDPTVSLKGQGLSDPNARLDLGIDPYLLP